MRIQSTGTLLLLSALGASLTTAMSFDCAHIKVNDYKYDFSPLGGVHEIYHVNKTEEYVTNTTYVLDICHSLGKASKRPDGAGSCEHSKNSTSTTYSHVKIIWSWASGMATNPSPLNAVCGFEDLTPSDGNGDQKFGFPIAGLDPMGGGSKEPKFTRLSEIDSNTQGLRLQIAGGSWKGEYNNKKAKDAAALIDFKCDPDRSGLEGISTKESVPEDEENKKQRRADGDEEEMPSNQSLQFKSFAPNDDGVYVLKLEWQTRYACDNYQDGNDASSNHWGFFTWLIIILFLCIAAYLIFGSWLNYNRYGARGWDLLPHGDAIRDIPYLLQDWFRRVVNTLQGTGSRGGYSAV
ncbi:Autophagy-related protein 27 [Penicillium argentinense]|uniref:Autophagy-related protein 27 n=1 Tax=Penicillium argentinense TaxID=1131581 RepID=A0A9W9FGR0_9EURO|nr:Autophagy-related protein 27 [Penicillium argentinense]KAJ5099908.1 Autophagy-related protein 27 [Penicillium argentinense]